MADFDEYRDKYFYECPFCGSKSYSYRNCGEISPCICGKDMKLVDFKKGKKVDYEEKQNDCANIITFKPYFDVGMGREISSKREIEKICKRDNLIYAGDKELTQQAHQNKRENDERQRREITQELQKEIMRKLS